MVAARWRPGALYAALRAWGTPYIGFAAPGGRPSRGCGGGVSRQDAPRRSERPREAFSRRGSGLGRVGAKAAHTAAEAAWRRFGGRESRNEATKWYGWVG